MTLEEFKATAATIKRTICESKDIIDKEHGIMIIHEENLMKYLEEYVCKDEEDLCNFLYYHNGIFVKIIPTEDNAAV